MSDLSKLLCASIGERVAGSSKRWFPHFKLCCVQSCGGSRCGCGDFAILFFCIT